MKPSSAIRCADALYAIMATVRHQGSTTPEQPPVVLRYVMTASADMSGSLNQLRRTELTASCRLAVWQLPHAAPIRCTARISGLSSGNFVHRQATRADLWAPERVATALNARAVQF
jgi:hypothetical protein